MKSIALLRTSFYSISLGTCLWLSGCGPAEPNIPAPGIVSISPEAGVPGTEVTITGVNFSETNSVVKFGDIEAPATSATTTQIIVNVPDNAITGTVTVTTEGGAGLSTNEFKVYQVYVAGKERLDGAKAIVKLWKNGVADQVSDGTDHATATGMVISGSDIYISGFIEPNSGITVPLYWKNKTVVVLPAEGGAVTTDIDVSGSDVYVSGYVNSRAIIWKNGTPMTLDRPTDTDSHVRAITVAGSDVHSVGDVNGPTGINIATYWKNGVVIATHGANAFNFFDIQLDGSDIYIAGMERFGSTWTAVFWKNDFPNLLGLDINSKALAITISEGEVYVGGDTKFGSIDVATVWKKETTKFITNGDTRSTVNKIVVVDGNVFLAGVINSQAYYAMNNTVFMLTTTNVSSSSIIGGLAVKW